MEQDKYLLLDQKTMRLAFGDDKAFACATMRIYMRDAPALAQKAYEALQAGDNQGLAANAHALKGITAYFTRGEMHKACLALEMLGRENCLPLQSVHALGLWASINSRLQDMLADMRRYAGDEVSDDV